MTSPDRGYRGRRHLLAIACMAMLPLGASASEGQDRGHPEPAVDASSPGGLIGTASALFGPQAARAAGPTTGADATPDLLRMASPAKGGDSLRTLQTVALYSVIWLAPMGALMLTAFVRINVVLVLLRQALGSPQIPGNQVLTALALMLTALVMRPVGEKVYDQAIVPYTSGRCGLAEAWTAGSTPIKVFMVDQIIKTKHQDYLWSLHHYAGSPRDRRPEPEFAHEFPFRVVAPAYLLSELTTALVIGFYVYLPFLVIDLVVSSVLAAMGLYMLPPTLVAMPLKLIVFVLADGWMLVAAMLLSSFGIPAT